MAMVDWARMKIRGAMVSWVTEVSVVEIEVPLSVALTVKVPLSRVDRSSPLTLQAPSVTAWLVVVTEFPFASLITRSTVNPSVAVPLIWTLSSSRTFR